MAFHHSAVALAAKGRAKESTIAYLRGLAIQTRVPSVNRDTNGAYFGEEFLWFDVNAYEHILSFLDVFALARTSTVSRAWRYYASSPTLWRKAYAKYFDIAQLRSDDSDDGGDTLSTAYNTLFRPWKYIFSFRFSIKQQFPVVALNFWFNGVEIASTVEDAHPRYIPWLCESD